MESKQPTDISILIKSLPKKGSVRENGVNWGAVNERKNIEEVKSSNETALSSTRECMPLTMCFFLIGRWLDAQCHAYEITLQLCAKPLSCSLHSHRLLPLPPLQCGFRTKMPSLLFCFAKHLIADDFCRARGDKRNTACC